MAVLVEAISVIVRRDAINKRFSGGWDEFFSIVPNNTFCADEDLVRVGFMSPLDVEEFVKHLQSYGLSFVQAGKAVDITVVDQMCGPTITTEWLEFARVSFRNSENKVATCWLFDEPRIAGPGIYTKGLSMTVATPDGWEYEDSLSANFKFHSNEEMQKNQKNKKKNKKGSALDTEDSGDTIPISTIPA